MKTIFTLLLVLATLFSLAAQPISRAQRDSVWVAKDDVYYVNRWASSGIIAGALIANNFLLKRIRDKPTSRDEDVFALQKEDVPFFDRWVFELPESNAKTSQYISDLMLWSMNGAPALLMLDREIRRDWLDIALIFLESQALQGSMYSMAPFGPTFTERYRPMAYRDDVKYESRVWGAGRNSMFSGHVSIVASLSFFTAKVYNDYHPGSRTWIPYTLAALPTVTAMVGRVGALKHFPSDVIIGALVGAGAGILVPSLHKKMGDRRRARVAMTGVYDTDFKSIGLSVQF